MEVKTRCPVCGGDATSIFTTYHIPNFGEALLTTISCDHCGYKSADVIIPTENNPKIYKLVVDSEDKLNYKVIRSSHGDIEIPELGIEIKSTGFSEGFITNVEGVLLRIEDTLESKIKNKNNEDVVNKIIKQLELARKGKMKFTLILRDKTGNSAITKAV